MAYRLSLLALLGIALPCFFGTEVDARYCELRKYSSVVIQTQYKNGGVFLRREINFYLDEDAQRAAMEAVDHSFKMICKLNTKTCSLYALTSYYCQRMEGVPVPDLLSRDCVEDAYDFVGNYTIGIPPSSFIVNEYSGFMKGRRVSTMVKADEPFVPLMRNYEGAPNEPGMSNLIWTNTRLNEVPEDAFDIPASCLRYGKRRLTRDQMPDFPLPLPFFGL